MGRSRMSSASASPSPPPERLVVASLSAAVPPNAWRCTPDTHSGRWGARASEFALNRRGAITTSFAPL